VLGHRPMLLAGAASLLASIAMLPFLLVHLAGSAMGEGRSLRTPFDQLFADLSLPTLESALLVVWLLLPFAWLVLAIAFFFTRSAHTGRAKALCLSSAVVGATSLTAYGWETGFLFLPPVLLACRHVIVAERPSSHLASPVAATHPADRE